MTVAGLAAHGFGEAVADILRYAIVQKYTAEEYGARIAGVWSAQVTAGASVGAVAAVWWPRWFRSMPRSPCTVPPVWSRRQCSP